jgi:hypothetical protein
LRALLKLRKVSLATWPVRPYTSLRGDTVKDAAADFLKVKSEALSAGCLYPGGAEDEEDAESPTSSPVPYKTSEQVLPKEEGSSESTVPTTEDAPEEQEPPEGRYV